MIKKALLLTAADCFFANSEQRSCSPLLWRFGIQSRKGKEKVCKPWFHLPNQLAKQLKATAASAASRVGLWLLRHSHNKKPLGCFPKSSFPKIRPTNVTSNLTTLSWRKLPSWKSTLYVNHHQSTSVYSIFGKNWMENGPERGALEKMVEKGNQLEA